MQEKKQRGKEARTKKQTGAMVGLPAEPGKDPSQTDEKKPQTKRNARPAAVRVHAAHENPAEQEVEEYKPESPTAREAEQVTAHGQYSEVYDKYQQNEQPNKKLYVRKKKDHDARSPSQGVRGVRGSPQASPQLGAKASTRLPVLSPPPKSPPELGRGTISLDDNGSDGRLLSIGGHVNAWEDPEISAIFA